ncbi:MAG: hypothetical protein A3E37_00570 [Candidatus Andersenbacteria bacterium RIFCSPHIGHO2_12_FULL_46_9]|nr:MAG: hypothetical protein UW94_C0001G0037 [Parcubacteria group bacterium GW2011_GWA2_45_14]OGY35095.1 MAG: hypothetical protein A3B76_04595 [Candidatus Andersenbacteria bacterium RIFCSPHIGHO2_02_FULL_46_16]OGY36489.1 MAG: hypothetical protein A3E37_00570 [Candidatus Andersenbacteria bacterium RIFCSPHIGHO2_12_FULL_46_9]HBE90440.1 hypothetical protein [Candidatus Andersenbacteria bacterium]
MPMRDLGRTISRFVKWEQTEVLLMIVGVKIALFALSIIVALLMAEAQGEETVMQFLLIIWDRWDSAWYHGLADTGYAATGYAANRIVFLPLYPILIRIVKEITGSFISASMSVSNIFSIVGLYLFYRLTRLELGRQVAWYALVAFLLFPSAYFFNAAYTEGVFLCLAVGAFYCARKGWWWGAGVLGSLAAFTKILGLFLFPALLLEFFLQRKDNHQKRFQVVWLSLIPGSFLVYLLYNYQLFGDWLAFMNVVGGNWQKSFSWPWVGLAERWRVMGSFPFSKSGVMTGLAEWLAGMGLLVGLVVSFFRLRTSYFVYLLGISFIILSTTKLESTPRYVLTAFPIFMLLGKVGKYRWLAVPLTLLSVGCMALFMGYFNQSWGAY